MGTRFSRSPLPLGLRRANRLIQQGADSQSDCRMLAGCGCPTCVRVYIHGGVYAGMFRPCEPGDPAPFYTIQPGDQIQQITPEAM